MKKIYLLLTLTILALSGCVDSGVEKRIKDLDNKLTTDLANGINSEILNALILQNVALRKLLQK